MVGDGGSVSAQLERASRLALEFDGVSWALCHGRTPFIEMSLSGISLVNLRNRDQSGAPILQSVCGLDAAKSQQHCTW